MEKCPKRLVVHAWKTEILLARGKKAAGQLERAQSEKRKQMRNRHFYSTNTEISTHFLLNFWGINRQS
jgi:hypothetical protein